MVSGERSLLTGTGTLGALLPTSFSVVITLIPKWLASVGMGLRSWRVKRDACTDPRDGSNAFDFKISTINFPKTLVQKPQGATLKEFQSG